MSKKKRDMLITADLDALTEATAYAIRQANRMEDDLAVLLVRSVVDWWATEMEPTKVG